MGPQHRKLNAQRGRNRLRPDPLARGGDAGKSTPDGRASPPPGAARVAPVVSPKVTLRGFRADDVDAVHRWFNNPEATATLMETRDSFTRDDAQGWVERAMRDSGEDRKWAIEVDGTPQPIGFTALYGLGRQTAPELGAMIGDDARGKGLGREAERLTVQKAFSEFDSHRVYGRIPAFNEPAKRAVTWLGWQKEGVMRGHIRRDGALIDCEIWGVTAAEWRDRWATDDS